MTQFDITNSLMLWEFPELTGPERSVYIQLSRYINSDLKCWPSESELQKLCRFADKTIKKSIKGLAAKGMIAIEVITTPKGRSNRYTMNLPRDMITSLRGDEGKSTLMGGEGKITLMGEGKSTPMGEGKITPRGEGKSTPITNHIEKTMSNKPKAGIKDKSAPPSYMQFSATDFDAFLAWTTNYNVDSVLRTFWLEKGITDNSRQRSFLEKAFSRMGQSTCPNESGRVRFLKSVLRSNFEEFYNAIEADALKAPPPLTEEEEIRQIEEFRARIKAEHALASQPTPNT